MGPVFNGETSKFIDHDIEQPLCFLGGGGRDLLPCRWRIHESNFLPHMSRSWHPRPDASPLRLPLLLAADERLHLRIQGGKRLKPLPDPPLTMVPSDAIQNQFREDSTAGTRQTRRYRRSPGGTTVSDGKGADRPKIRASTSVQSAGSTLAGTAAVAG
jgi:hypothetical protein